MSAEPVIVNKFATASIIGAGPVGSMQTLLLATLFPQKKVYLLDRYHKNIRGHGLLIWNSTTDFMIKHLQAIKKNIQHSLHANPNHPNALQYQRVLTNIDKTTHFLKKNLKSFLIGPFIRTQTLCDMLQNLAKELAGNNLEILLNNEVTETDLKSLLENDSPLAEKTSLNKKILQESKLIFAANGAHSRFRTIVFQQDEDSLEKETLTYLLEHKIDMKEKSPVFIKGIKRSILAGIKNGYWSQGKDGVATLHILINKEVYDLVKSKKYLDENGVEQSMGEFVMPYRRLMDLPKILRQPINQAIHSVIGAEDILHDSIKITAIPMLVYKAKNLIKQQQDRTMLLEGDAAIGLALINGVNNGFKTAAEYSSALFNESNLNQCEKRIKDIADKKIVVIKKQVNFVNFLNRTIGQIFSPFSLKPRKEKIPANRHQETRQRLKKLKKTIPHFDYQKETDHFTQFASWLFYMDNLYFELKNRTTHAENHPSAKKLADLNLFILNTKRYVEMITSQDKTNEEKLAYSKKYQRQAKKYKKELMRPILNEGLKLIYQQHLKNSATKLSVKDKPFDILLNLQLKIAHYDQQANTPQHRAVVESLNKLLHDLKTDVNNQFLSVESEATILHSTAIKLAQYTTTFLEKLESDKNRIQALSNYQKNCLSTSTFSDYLFFRRKLLQKDAEEIVRTALHLRSHF